MLIDHDTSGRNDKPTGTEFADDKYLTALNLKVPLLLHTVLCSGNHK